MAIFIPVVTPNTLRAMLAPAAITAPTDTGTRSPATRLAMFILVRMHSITMGTWGLVRTIVIDVKWVAEISGFVVYAVHKRTID